MELQRFPGTKYHAAPYELDMSDAVDTVAYTEYSNQSSWQYIVDARYLSMWRNEKWQLSMGLYCLNLKNTVTLMRPLSPPLTLKLTEP